MALKHTNPSDLPKHKSPDDNHRAIAPYNFVPLPDMIIPAVADAEALPNHNTYAHPDYPHTGYFEVTLTTLTPTYIRGMLTEQEFRWQEEGKYLDGEDLPKDGNPDFRRLVKNKPDFFMVQEKPVIPGSSLRGMLRQLVEIVTYSKMKWVTDKRLFFRTVDGTSIGKYYNKRMVEEVGKVQVGNSPSATGYRARVRGGWLRKRSDGTYYIEESLVGRIEIKDVLAILGLSDRSELYELDGRDLRSDDEKKSPNQTPKWAYQYQNITVDLDKQEQDHFFRAKQNKYGKQIHPDFYLRFYQAEKPSATSVPGKRRQTGQLILSGHVGSKHMTSVFVKAPNPRSFEIPNDPGEADLNKRLIDRFHDDDQLTPWQQSAFPKDKPHSAKRDRDGFLQEGDPVFFLEENNQVIFLGRAQMFRLPYRKRPLDLIPDDLRDPAVIDFAEAMFGFIRTNEEMKELKIRKIEPKQGSKGYAYASRVFVTDAHYNEEQGDPWLPVDTPDGILEPPILATPKPTAFQHYLTQQNPNNKKELQHYDSSNTTLRGFKLYWAQGQKKIADFQAKPRGDKDPNFEQGPKGKLQVKSRNTQHTRMKPVGDGKTFTFRVYFENLKDVELGALQWILALPQCHRLGMGKPLGMGVIKLNASLHLTPRDTRYSNLLADWNDEPAKNEQDFSGKFEAFMVSAIVANKPFQQIDRIQMLLAMLEWREGIPEWQAKTRYMEIERPTGRHRSDGRPETFNEYKERPVLPDPIGVISGPAGSRSSGQRPSGGPGHDKRQDNQRDHRGGRQHTSRPQQAQHQKSPRHQSERHPPKQNRPQQTVDDSLPEVRDEVSDFAKSFAQQLQEQGSPRDEQRKKKKKKR